MNIKAFFLATLFGLTASPFYAQQPNNEWKETPNRVTLSGSLLTYGSDPGYDVTISYTRFLNRFLGIAGGISFQSWYMDDYKPQWEVTDRNGKTYQLDNDESTLKKLIFQVGPVFRLPFLTFGRDKDMTISWECHPAAAFTFPNMTFSYLLIKNWTMGNGCKMKDGYATAADNGITGNWRTLSVYRTI